MSPEKIADADEPARVRQCALDLLARREHSSKELNRKLNIRGFDGVIIASTLAELANAGLQSEERYTEAYVASRVAKGFGPLRILKELLERGIDAALANTFLDNYAENWDEKIRLACTKRFGKMTHADVNSRAKKARFLQYRGYTGEQIQRLFADSVKV